MPCVFSEYGSRASETSEKTKCRWAHNSPLHPRGPKKRREQLRRRREPSRAALYRLLRQSHITGTVLALRGRRLLAERKPGARQRNQRALQTLFVYIMNLSSLFLLLLAYRAYRVPPTNRINKHIIHDTSFLTKDVAHFNKGCSTTLAPLSPPEVLVWYLYTCMHIRSSD